jgi:hypothetical protein
MKTWQLLPAKLKQYPHFDKPLSVMNATALATDPERVRTHPFFPFIRFEKSWTRFRRKGRARKKKTRALRYAARGDAYIYSYYRHLLSDRYETILAEENLSEAVLAYRKIPVGEGRRGGKCNIHFAKEAFDFISRGRRTCAVTLDISDFFECIDHGRLKTIWLHLLGVARLPADHFQVYKSLTSYTEVDREALYFRLGFLKRDRRGAPVYTRSKDEMPRQLCSPADFRLKVANDGPAGPKLITRNKNPHGIPQGAALSDLLANAYLLDFDRAMAAYARKRNGLYLRYSDDILIIVPGDGRAGRGAREYASRLIRHFGDKLEIKSDKSSTVRFFPSDGAHSAERIEKTARTDGLEYLGFRFDGRNVYFRESTLTNVNRKIKRAARGVAHSLVSRYPGKDVAFLASQLNPNAFMAKFGRVSEFDASADYSSWTFWSYAKKAAEIFDNVGRPLFLQLKGQREMVKRVLREELVAATKSRRR